MRFPFPRTLTSQLVAIMIVVLIVSQIVSLIITVGSSRLLARQQDSARAISRLVREIQALDLPDDMTLPYLIFDGGEELSILHIARVSQVERMRDVVRDNGAARRLEKALTAAGIKTLQVDAGRRSLDGVRQQPPPRQNGPDELYRPHPRPSRTGPMPPGVEDLVLSVKIRPGLWVNGSKVYYSVNSLSVRIALLISGTAIISSLILWLFARRISQPLQDLAVSADRLGRGQTSEHVAEQGPEDVRMAAHAFNQMQDRLTRLLETQRTMLRAVGHDLRTPLTSLRIRAESVPVENGRDQMIATLEDMRVMTEEILRWAKESSGLEPVSSVDMGAFLESLSDDYADQGLDVSFADVEKPVIVECRRVALRRAVQNLVDNALKYGVRARLSLEQENGDVLISVEDDGPGVPAHMMDEICKPFVRLETSRSKDTGGLGLGLAIVQSVVLTHGGRLVFRNRKEGGLIAQIAIPKS